MQEGEEGGGVEEEEEVVVGDKSQHRHTPHAIFLQPKELSRNALFHTEQHNKIKRDKPGL